MKRYLISNDQKEDRGQQSTLSCLKSRVKGMIYGVAIADAQGVPMEFARTTPKLAYSDRLNEQDFQIQFQWTCLKVPASSFSDDTEMTLCLLHALLENNLQYKEDAVILKYLFFAKESKMMGKNTRRLFKGISTVSAYRNRVAKLGKVEHAKSQSNGSLMRASPLSLLSNFDTTAIQKDVSLTNPNQVNIYCSLIYIWILRHLLRGGSKEECREFCEYLCNQKNKTDIIDKMIELDECFMDTSKIPPEVATSLIDSLSVNFGCNRDIKSEKGWVCNSLYIALFAFWNYETFEDAMRFIIKDHPGSDTDTNAAIAGAIFGAWLGSEKMNLESNTNHNMQRIEIFSKTKLSPIFHLSDDLIEQIMKKAPFISKEGIKRQKTTTSPEAAI
jgi:ADP-ribosyl-[dinitrogen reductase] hydrolase